MTRPLRDAMQAYLATWRHDIPQAWEQVLNGIEPDIDAVPSHLTQNKPIIPLHRDHADRSAPAGSHLLKALDSVRPEDVRVVLLGQDPYPKISQATGRSFEQGDLLQWAPHPAAPTSSLRRIVQVLATHRRPDHPFARQHRPLVLMLWGDKAQKAVAAMGLPSSGPTTADADAPVIIEHPHPNAGQRGKPFSPFFDRPNPFTRANEQLATPIDW